MIQFGWLVVLAAALSPLVPGVGFAADDSKVKAATNQVEQGAQKTAGGKIGDGVAETARGIGQTVSEGAQYSAEKVKEAGPCGKADGQERMGPRARWRRRVRAQRRAVLRESVYQMKRPSIVKDRAACATRMGTCR